MLVDTSCTISRRYVAFYEMYELNTPMGEGVWSEERVVEVRAYDAADAAEQFRILAAGKGCVVRLLKVEPN